MQSKSRRRSIRVPTAQSLENVALFYLSRYAASEFSLRRVLDNRLRRAARVHPAFAQDAALQEQLKTTIDLIIQKHIKTGVLNDGAFAEMKIAGLRRAGRSARAIKQKLAQRGIARPLIEQALEKQANEDGDDAELKAATILARRRKWGPFRRKEPSPEERRKDFAALARAGFSLDVVRALLGKSAEDAIDEM